MRQISRLICLVWLLLLPSLASAGGLVVLDESGRATSLGQLNHLQVEVVVDGDHAEIIEHRRYVVESHVADQRLRFYRPMSERAESLTITVAEQPVDHATVVGNYASLRRAALVRQLREPGVLRGAGEPLAESAPFVVRNAGWVGVDVVVRYREALDRRDTMRGLQLPIDWQEQAVGSMSVTVTATSEAPLRAMYSPFHALDVTRTSDHAASGTYAGYHVCTTNDFVLLLSSGNDEVHLDILPYRYGDADGGFFMALLTPSQTTESIPRDLVFVVDTSGSMEGEKIVQARDALTRVIEGLSSKDRFTIVEFDNTAKSMSEQAQPAGREFVRDATAYVDGLVAGGGTNLYDAIQMGFDALPFNEDRPRYIVVLTDGQPTEGETDTEAILESVKRRNEGQARLFSFGIGNDVNTVLLDRLAIDSAGDAIYIRPGQPVGDAVDAFFASIAGAALVNPTIGSDDFAFTEAFPEALPDLFANQTLAVVGRYGVGGTGEVVLRGSSGGRQITRRFEVDLPDYSTRNGHVPRIWATRAVGTLLHQIKLGDADPTLVDRATELASRFGVVTEFTNFVVDEDGNAIMRYTDVPLDVTGSTAVDTSASLDGYQNSGSAQMRFEDFVRYVGARTLPTFDGWFTDTSITQPDWVDVHFGSELFFSLLTHGEIVRYLSVARDVAFELHGVDYRVTDAAADREVPSESAVYSPPSAPASSDAAARLIVEESNPIPPRDASPQDEVEGAPADDGRVKPSPGCSSANGVPSLLWMFAGLVLIATRRRRHVL